MVGGFSGFDQGFDTYDDNIEERDHYLVQRYERIADHTLDAKLGRVATADAQGTRGMPARWRSATPVPGGYKGNPPFTEILPVAATGVKDIPL